MSLRFVLSSSSTLSTHFSQLKTQAKPISYSSEGKKMRKKMLVSDIQTIFA